VAVEFDPSERDRLLAVRIGGQADVITRQTTPAKLFGVRRTSFAPSFWSNALVTMLILLGPAIEDAAVGKDVYSASATRVALFVAVALYAWATVWVLERWRASKSKALGLKGA